MFDRLQQIKTLHRKNKTDSYICSVLTSQYLQQISERLTGTYEPEEARAITSELIQFYTGWSKSELLIQQSELKPEVQQSVEAAIKRLFNGEPLQYILGEAWFYGLAFNVNASVLIPRPETEELVHKIIHETSSSLVRLLDIGTGSGCIAISLKKHLPHASVTALDISPEALQVAMSNAHKNQVEVQFVEGDILKKSIPGLERQSFHLIVSNPPYITEIEKLEMKDHVLDHEPHQALFVTDGNPMQFYDAIAQFASQHLVAGGRLYVEINKLYGAEVAETFKSVGFQQVEIVVDMHGNQRIVSGRLAD